MEPTLRVSQVWCCLIPNPSEETCGTCRLRLCCRPTRDRPTRETGPTGPRDTGHAWYELQTTSSVKCHYSIVHPPALAVAKSRCSSPLSAHPLGRAAFLSIQVPLFTAVSGLGFRSYCRCPSLQPLVCLPPLPLHSHLLTHSSLLAHHAWHPTSHFVHFQPFTSLLASHSSQLFTHHTLHLTLCTLLLLAPTSHTYHFYPCISHPTSHTLHITQVRVSGVLR